MVFTLHLQQDLELLYLHQNSLTTVALMSQPLQDVHCNIALKWHMVLSCAAQHSTAPLATAAHTLHMAQVLVVDAGETLIGYIGMVID